MKYTPKELKGNVNVSNTSPIKEFFLLSGDVLAFFIVIYAVFGICVDLIASPYYFSTNRHPETRLNIINNEIQEKGHIIGFEKKKASIYRDFSTPRRL